MNLEDVPPARAFVDELAYRFDRALLHLTPLAQRSESSPSQDQHDHRLSRLCALREQIDNIEESTFWPVPQGIIRARLIDRRVRIQDRQQIHWASSHTRLLAAAAPWFEPAASNSHARARVALHSSTQSVVVLIHGYLSGHSALERLLWPARQLRKLGFDLCWPVLPFHGTRAPSRWRLPPFPGRHVALNVEALRQSVLDLQELIQWLRRQGYERIGLIGFSLGAYVAALTGTLDPNLGFVVPIAPSASLADFAGSSGALGEGRMKEELHAALGRCYRRVCPVVRAPAVPRERWFVVGARGDGITGAAQASALARHVGANLWLGSGGHVLQPWRASAWEAIQKFLAASG